MKANEIILYTKSLGKLVDVLGWQKWFGAAVLGFAFALGINSNFSFLQFQGLIIGVPLILCYIQSVNDYFDVEIDEVKEKITGKGLIVSKIISKKTTLSITVSILMIGFVSAVITSLDFLLVVLLMALLGTLYSVPPFRLKMKYPFSTLTQFVGCFLPFLAGIASIDTITLRTIIISSIFAVLAMVHRLQHEIGNYKADLQTGKGTVAVVKGLTITKIFLSLCVLVGISEFAIFFIFGWFNIVFSFLFVLYLTMIILFPLSLRYTPKSLKRTFFPILHVSGLVLLFAALALYGKFPI